MIKKILIGIGAVISLLLISTWVYLLLFGPPDISNGVFTSFGLGTTETERPVYVPNNTNSIVSVDEDESLTQLTTRPVAGYIAINSTSTNSVRYAERGTGHIYEIDFNSNVERKLLGNTVAGTSEAYFSPAGTGVVLVTNSNNVKAATFYTVTGTEDTTKTSLTGKVENINVLDSSTVLYTTTTNNITTAYSFNRISDTATELWNVPLTDIRVWWGDLDNTYISNKPAPFLEGSLYKVTPNGLIPMGEQHYAYNVTVNDDNSQAIETYYDFDTENTKSYYLNLKDGNKTAIPIVALPEKCTLSVGNLNKLWCGALIPGSSKNSRTYMNDWYAGNISSNDNLWETNVDSESSLVLANLFDRAGFVIDVTNLSISPDGEALFFTNKINDALWRYKLEETSAAQEEVATETETN